MEYEFGMMSKRWSLEAENNEIAFISMSLYIRQNIPIAVYKPIQTAFLPSDVLENHMEKIDTINPTQIQKSLGSIKELI